MTKKDAEKLVKQCSNRHCDDWNHSVAKGFLEGLNSPEALQRPEVLELIKVIEKRIGSHGHECSAHTTEKIALAKYREAIATKDLKK